MHKVDSPDDAVVPSDPKADVRRLVADGRLDANAATRLLLEIDKQQRRPSAGQSKTVSPET